MPLIGLIPVLVAGGMSLRTLEMMRDKKKRKKKITMPDRIKIPEPPRPKPYRMKYSYPIGHPTIHWKKIKSVI